MKSQNHLGEHINHTIRKQDWIVEYTLYTMIEHYVISIYIHVCMYMFYGHINSHVQVCVYNLLQIAETLLYLFGGSHSFFFLSTHL